MPRKTKPIRSDIAWSTPDRIEVRGRSLPDELLYDVENHIWYQELADGNVKLGMTAVDFANKANRPEAAQLIAAAASAKADPKAIPKDGKW